MTKRGSHQQRQQQQQQNATGGQQQMYHKKDCNNILAKAGSLEVVSEENFKQRRDGIASSESCQDCLKERGKEQCKKSRRRKKREPMTKHNSPIIVRLSDSIKVSVKGKMQSTPRSSDMESACSTDSEDSVSALDVNVRSQQQRGPSVHNDLRTKAIQGQMRAKGEKNFNALLSAIQKVHKKDGRSYRCRSYKSNLLTERNMTTFRKDCTLHVPPQLSMLNNFRDYHYGNHTSGYLSHHPRALKSLDPKSVKFVQNDLHGKVNLEKQDSLEDSESVISSSTDCHSDLESGNSSSSLDSYTSSAEDLSCEELQYLTGYASGSSLMRYECPPAHECPECLAAYHTYSHYHPAQAGDFFSFEVLGSSISSCPEQDKYYNKGRWGENGNQTRRRQPSCQTSDSASIQATYQVTHIGNGQVEVSLADFHSDSEKECDSPVEQLSSKQQHIENTPNFSGRTSSSSRSSGNNANISRSKRSRSSSQNLDGTGGNLGNCNSLHKPHCAGISLDLTNTNEITFTVEYHTEDRMAPTHGHYHQTSTASKSSASMSSVPSHSVSSTASCFQSYSQQPPYSPHRANHSSYTTNATPYQHSNSNNSEFFPPEMFYYNYYSPTVGFFPYAVPYYLTPPYFYMCPLMTSIPRPLCIPRDLQCLQSQRLCLIPASEIKTFTASQPPQRPWLPLAHPDNSRPVAIYTVMCYNVLCDKYCTRQLYGYCPSWALVWEYRKKAIMEEIRQYSADIISLQEVETEQFYNFFLPELKRDGYSGIFSPKSRAKTMSDIDKKHVDGCAIFYRSTKFNLLKEHLVEFNQLAMSNADGSHDMINRVMTKDNIALAALLETKEAAWENGVPSNGGKQPILVATCHIHWDPEFSDVKLVQTMMLMSELKNIIEESGTSLRPGSTQPDSNSIPLLLCGDLNSLPNSGVVEYLSTGKVAANHDDFRDLGYDACLRKLSMTENQELYTHSFRLTQAYEKSVIPYTNYTYDFKGIIDYIFFSRDSMRPLGLLGPLDQDWFRDNKVVGCPHPHVPSDHLPLLVEVEMCSPSNTTSTTGVRR